MKISRFVFILILITMLLAPAGPGASQERTAKAQPQLLQLAMENPDQMVSIIVQNQDHNNAEALTAKLGGKVTQRLNIINAFVAEMSAQDALELSRKEMVRWVSLDSKVVSSA